MNHGDLMFWIAVVVVVSLGTIGGILFKFGTNALGTITFEKLLELKASKTLWIYGALMVGGFLIFLFGGINLRSKSFAMEYLFSPIIFSALVLMFLSRFLVGIPLSTTGLGRLTAITTPLLLVFTTIVSVIVFKEEVHAKLLAGIILGIFAIILLNSE